MPQYGRAIGLARIDECRIFDLINLYVSNSGMLIVSCQVKNQFVRIKPLRHGRNGLANQHFNAWSLVLIDLKSHFEILLPDRR